ncbi:divergent polysaccharide deacetylase family protein [Phenylobacterium sp.]|uniref:divergent polysaccharide deacetylase family protein n=1 Tax=Phenylobacterium sp. TaxID=1871053 RepID=UPI00121EB2CF|nr:divergent polysaccharide deacetylase family protein [Phenylobacterium sp.]THD58695.1 MAG: divergent polysaccharide deacetylase family protein [Phenylobacterium sp.]
MAAVHLPRLSGAAGAFSLRGLTGNPWVRAGAAALLLVAAVLGLARTLGAVGRTDGTVRVSLSKALAHAPQGWRETLKPLRGPAPVSQDVIQLSERPLPAPSAAAPSRPGQILPPPAPGAPLPAAPIAGFFAPGPAGPLPIIAQDGHTPFEAYRRPFAPNGRPRIALMIGGLGLNARLTQQAIETLPAEITLSFSPYAEGLQGWIDMARAHGHEVLLEAPMEPVDYPDNDPGPYTLMAGAQGPETVKKLEWILSRATGYFGITNYLGSRFLGSDGAYQAFAGGLKARGLAFVDDGSAARRGGKGLARASAERVVDDQLNTAAIDQQLVALEAGALQRGQALGSGFAYPVTVEKVAAWSRALTDRGFQLTPVSALAH